MTDREADLARQLAEVTAQLQSLTRLVGDLFTEVVKIADAAKAGGYDPAGFEAVVGRFDQWQAGARDLQPPTTE